MKTGYVIAVDQGTTGSTVLIFDHDGAVKGRAYSEFTQHYPQPGWVEHDATEIWDVTHRVVGEALKIASVNASEIRAIGITNQRETVVLWDRKTGQPVSRAIVWQDRRTSDYCTQLKAEGREQTFRKKTGLVIDPYFSGTKVRWLLKHDPEMAKRAEKGEIAFGTIDSWLVYKMSGDREHITDYSNASRTLLYNIYELKWDQEILSLFEIPEAILPEVMPSSHIYCETQADRFYGASVPISGIAGDQQSALFGQACFGPGLAKNTYGTGSFVLMNTGNVAPIGKGKLLTTIAWKVGDEPVEYALEGAVFVTGAAVQWLRDGLKIIGNAKETEALARSVESTGGVYFVPALTGLGAPHWDPYARGALLGITRGTTRAHIARAVLESICFQVRDVLEAMAEETGLAFDELPAGLRADGGASINSFLMQFQADQLGVAVEVPKIIETTALGAAYLAGLATGFWSGRDELSAKWKLAQRYEPNLDETTRATQYRWWKKAVERAKGWEEPEESPRET